MDMQDRAFYEGVDRLVEEGIFAHSVHKPSGEHFLTNLPAQRRSIVKQAAEETGLPVYVKDVATDVQGYIMPSFISVWIESGQGDLKSFWKVYEHLVAESEKDER